MKTESNETSKVFVRRKKSTYGQTHRRNKREQHPQGSLNHLHGTFLPSFVCPIILICLVQSPFLVYLKILSCVQMHLLAKMDSTKEAYGQLSSVNITSLLTSKELFAHVQSGRSPDLQNRTYVVSCLLSWQGPSSPLNCPAIFILKYLSWGHHLAPTSLAQQWDCTKYQQIVHF